MYIQGLLGTEREFLILNDCHCGETNCTGYDSNTRYIGFDPKIIHVCYFAKR